MPGRFEGRFRAMERALGRPMKDLPLPELVAAWQRAKREHAEAKRD